MSLTARQRLQRYLRTNNQQTNNGQLMRPTRVQQIRNEPRRRVDELREPIRRRILSRERMNSLPENRALNTTRMLNGPNQQDVVRRIREVRNNQNERYDEQYDDQYDDYYDDYDRYDDYYNDYEEEPRQTRQDRPQQNRIQQNQPQRLTLRSMQRESLNKNKKMNSSDRFMDLDSPDYDERDDRRTQQNVQRRTTIQNGSTKQNDDNYDDHELNDDYEYSGRQGMGQKEDLRDGPINKEDNERNELSKEIQERYNELIKELWNNEQKINMYELPQALKEAMNERMKLWLEYFLTNSSFRTSDTNMFEYLDTFTNTTTFI